MPYDEDGNKYEQCGDCEEGMAYHCTIYGSEDTYIEHVCGRCGVPLCGDCESDSTWRYDGHSCCRKCCSELDEEEDE